MKIKHLLLCLSILFFTSCSYKRKLTAENIILSPYYSSGMVLQTSPGTLIQGYADAESVLAVRIKDYIKVVETDNNGKWQVAFPEIIYGKSFSIKIEGKDTVIIYRNVHAGKVYIVLGDAGLDPIDAHDRIKCSFWDLEPGKVIRVFQAKPCINNNTPGTLNGKWQPGEEAIQISKTCKSFSFLDSSDFHSAKAIGVIDLTFPGSEIENWMSADSYIQPEYEKILALNSALLDSIIYLRDSSRLGLQKRVNRIWYNDTDWRITQLPGNLGIKMPPGKRIMYLRKKINIPPRLVTSDFTISMQNIVGDAEFYFNEKVLAGLFDSSNTVHLHIEDTLIQSYTNVLGIRMFLKDSIAGIYGSVHCFNQDSSFFKNLDEEWKYNTQLEPDFPLYNLTFSIPGCLYNQSIKPLIDQPVEKVIWYEEGDTSERTINHLTKLTTILNYFTSSQSKVVATPYIFSDDSLIRKIAEDNNILLHSTQLDME